MMLPSRSWICSMRKSVGRSYTLVREGMARVPACCSFSLTWTHRVSR